jgi:hypothetical protein
MWSRVTPNPRRIFLMPPTPVSGAPRTSHDAADTPGIKSDHRSRSMSASYTDAGGAVDGCSTLIDTEVGITRKLLHVEDGTAGFGKAAGSLLRRPNRTTSLRMNSHLSSTHRYQLTAASCTAAQQLSGHCPVSIYLRPSTKPLRIRRRGPSCPTFHRVRASPECGRTTRRRRSGSRTHAWMTSGRTFTVRTWILLTIRH